jgi:hypothetical protein
MDQSFQPQVPPQQPPPKNWLVESILVTIFCCLPFGIAGIVFASQVNSKAAAGDYAGATEAARNAAKWTKIGFWVGIAVIACSILVNLIFGVAFWRSGVYNRY